MLQQVYEAFNHSNFKDDVYIVLLYSIYSTSEKKLVCSSAGMNEAPLLINKNGDVNEIDISGFPICKLKDVYEVIYSEFEIPVKSGDRLYLYTDGLIEARSSEQQQYSKERLQRLLHKHCDKALTELSAIITDDLFQFSNEKRLTDDVTLLAIEIR
jgi:sigma-B regulation protein RsbU (phosphoserine phosphatase)